MGPGPRTLRVATPEAASVFTDPKRRRILVQFLGRERSLSEAGRVLAMPLNRLSHHVGTFLRLGLLLVVREQARAGRPIRYYRAAADSFLIPADLMRKRAGAALSAELRDALEQADRISGESDMLLSLDEEGRPRMEHGEAGENAGASEYWRVLNLNRSDARQLARDLADLLRGYDGRSAKGSAPYLVHVAMAPRRAS